MVSRGGIVECDKVGRAQRRLDKVMCTMYQIVETAKRSLPIDLL